MLLGGFTASYYAEEILNDFDCVDFVIRGDAEIPLREIVARHATDKAYREVPNLAFRNKGSVFLGPVSYVADESMLNGISYTDFSLMKDYRVFVEFFSRSMNVTGLSLRSQRLLTGWDKSYPVFLGRGCSYNCSYCGGSREAQQIINNRSAVCMRAVSTVLDSLRDLERFGFECAYLAFDPLPVEESEEFYAALFDGIKRLGISINLEIERFSLPTPGFIRKFGQSLGKGSFITLSPNSHSEDIRKKNGLFRYSNRELEECLEVMDKEEVRCVVYFSCLSA